MEDKNIEHPEKKGFFKKIPLIALIGLAAGAIGGYIYYAKVGCVSGTCAITSNPWMSTAWGGAFGYLVFDMFNRPKKNGKQEQKE
jgi:hypothetical protein